MKASFYFRTVGIITLILIAGFIAYNFTYLNSIIKKVKNPDLQAFIFDTNSNLSLENSKPPLTKEKALQDSIERAQYWIEKAVENIGSFHIKMDDRPFPIETKDQIIDRVISKGFFSDTAIIVDDIDEFIIALKDNKTILLESGNYVFWLDNYEEYESKNSNYKHGVFHNLENVTIIGIGPTSPVIQVDDRYSEALSFKFCKNIFISNLILGHTTKTDEDCEEGVFQTENCKKIFIEKSVLFGCGTMGFELRDTDSITISNCLITDCSIQHSIFKNSTVNIENSLFTRNNRASYGFAVMNSKIAFSNTKIDHPSLKTYDNLKETYKNKGLFFQDYDEVKNTTSISFNETLINGQLFNRDVY